MDHQNAADDLTAAPFHQSAREALQARSLVGTNHAILHDNIAPRADISHESSDGCALSADCRGGAFQTVRKVVTAQLTVRGVKVVHKGIRRASKKTEKSQFKTLVIVIKNYVADIKGCVDKEE